jgi:hypothetical protein
MPPVRRLTAILAADVAGYSRLMGADEEGTHERLQAHLGELVEPKISQHRGRTVKNSGDGFLAEFASVVDAVRCAAEVQRGMIDREPEVPEERRIRFRICVNLGDVIAEEEDRFGDGVNVATIEVGVMELNRWPDNYFAEVEQAAFGPSNVVPGISFSPDRMLQARLFSYNDTVRYRLGVNFYQIPVNAPKCPVMSYHRDGQMRVDGNLGGTTSFNPNSAGLWDNQPDFAEPPLPIEGEAAHYNHYADDDHWEQPGNLFRLMTPAQQQALFENTARAMGDARLHIKERHIANCFRADPAYGEGVARALGLDVKPAAE